MNILQARTPHEMDEVRRLFREYEVYLNVDLCFQQFEAELANLPGRYAPPSGILLLAKDRQKAVGCGALRRLDTIQDRTCEMKRLYVKPEGRGRGIGKQIARRLIQEGVRLGYSAMLLDTLDRLDGAIHLYESLGFVRTDPYYDNPLPDVVYWKLNLRGNRAAGGFPPPAPTPPSMKIRKASSADKDNISRLHIASIRKLCVNHYTREQLNAWTSVLKPFVYDQALKKKVFLVAHDSQRDLLGMGILDVERAEISAIYIHPDATGKGVGSKLLNELEKIARKSNIFKITVYSTLNAKSFYMAHGYSEQELTFHNLSNGSKLECIRMFKNLLNRDHAQKI